MSLFAVLAYCSKEERGTLYLVKAGYFDEAKQAVAGVLTDPTGLYPRKYELSDGELLLGEQNPWPIRTISFEE